MEDDADGDDARKSHAPITPVSLQSMHKATDVADDEDDFEMEDAPARPAARKPAPKTSKASAAGKLVSKKSNPKSKSKRNVSPPASEHEADDSSLSELEEASESDEATPDSDSDVVMTDKAFENRSSPQVVLTPPSKAVSQRSTRGIRKGRKATPLKSQYFANSDGDEDDDDGEESSEAEVVKPRATTKRTRGSA